MRRDSKGENISVNLGKFADSRLTTEKYEILPGM